MMGTILVLALFCIIFMCGYCYAPLRDKLRK